MPIHDWTRADKGTFPDFHALWLVELRRALNHGVLPSNYHALVEQDALGLVPDVLTREVVRLPEPNSGGAGELALLTAPPRIQPVARADLRRPLKRRKTIAVRVAPDERLVAVIEVISPGNKSSRHGLHSFLQKAVELLKSGIHLMILDLHPPGPFDPQGLHAALWHRVTKTDYQPPLDKPLTFASYDADENRVIAYNQPAAVGNALPQLPLFLLPGLCVELPLEPSYTAAFAEVPSPRRGRLEAMKRSE